MNSFSYVGGRGRSYSLMAYVILPNGKTTGFWEALEQGLVTRSSNEQDSYYSSMDTFLVSININQNKTYFGIKLYETSGYSIRILNPFAREHFTWNGYLIKNDALLKKLEVSSSMWRSVNFQDTLPSAMTQQIIQVEKAKRIIKGRRLAITGGVL